MLSPSMKQRTRHSPLEGIVTRASLSDAAEAFVTNSLLEVMPLRRIDGKELPIIPGMVAEVDILTGKRSLLSYLMKPVLRAKANALTER